jgi:hypothetical protein
VSGGSFNYLYSKDASEIHNAIGDLEAARDRLAGLGYAEEAAQAVTDILDTIQAFDAVIDVKMSRIGGVLRALEWWDSNDCDEDAVRAAIADFSGGLEDRVAELFRRGVAAYGERLAREHPGDVEAGWARLRDAIDGDES